jgi:glutamate-1-semialdehyde 2,1-aminomutase
MSVAGFTSTGSKHPEVLFGAVDAGTPLRMTASHGCTVVGADGREYLDFLMALGAVALGYGHEGVSRAAIEAIDQGGIGPLAPAAEEMLAADLARLMPGLEQVRFLKTGAEAAAAAVRLARVITGRDRVLGCGYHGWLDWCSNSTGVPAATRELYQEIPFNDPERSAAAIRAAGDALACVVLEPVIEAEPRMEWLTAVRNACDETGAVLIYDEIKTAFRVALGGATARWGVAPDLTVLGKALANGFPLAAIGGPASLMRHVRDTWISSTMATEWISIAAARATLRVMEEQQVPAHLHRVGEQLLMGLRQLAERYPSVVAGASGIEELCYLRYHEEEASRRVALRCAERGLLFKRSAYNFVSLAHGPVEVDRALEILDDALHGMTTGG